MKSNTTNELLTEEKESKIVDLSYQNKNVLRVSSEGVVVEYG